MKLKAIILFLMTSIFIGCNGKGYDNSGSQFGESSNNSDSELTYNCSIEGNGIEGCWESEPCAATSSDGIYTKILFEISSGTAIRIAAFYSDTTCTGEPNDYIELEDGSIQYSYDSTVISSEGIETDLYQFGGYTLVSIEGNRMCFSEGFYTADTDAGHSFNFVSEEEVSMDVNFSNCFVRI